MDVRQKLWEEATKRWSNRKNSSTSCSVETEEPGVKSGGCVPRKRGRKPPDATLSNNLSPARSVPNLQSQLQGIVVFRKHRHMPSGIHTCTHTGTHLHAHTCGGTRTHRVAIHIEEIEEVWVRQFPPSCRLFMISRTPLESSKWFYMFPKNAKDINETVWCAGVCPELRGFLKYGTFHPVQTRTLATLGVTRRGLLTGLSTCDFKRLLSGLVQSMTNKAWTLPSPPQGWAPSLVHPHQLSLRLLAPSDCVSALSIGLIWKVREANIVLPTTTLHFWSMTKTS